MTTYPTTPVEIILADEKVRHLRYPLGTVRRIKEKYAVLPVPGVSEADASASTSKAIQAKILSAIGEKPEEALPYLLMEGLCEKEGLTEQIISDELISGPMVDYVSLCVVEAFFGPRLANLLRDRTRIEDAVQAKAIEGTLEALKPAKTETPELPKVTPATGLLQ